VLSFGDVVAELESGHREDLVGDMIDGGPLLVSWATVVRAGDNLALVAVLFAAGVRFSALRTLVCGDGGWLSALDAWVCNANRKPIAPDTLLCDGRKITRGVEALLSGSNGRLSSLDALLCDGSERIPALNVLLYVGC
jgi:hypothetical protein